jgi:hypothetical protein
MWLAYRPLFKVASAFMKNDIEWPIPRKSFRIDVLEKISDLRAYMVPSTEGFWAFSGRALG